MTQTKELLYQGELMTAYKVPNGLNFVLTDDGRAELATKQEFPNCEDNFIELAEELAANGVFSFVSAEDVGALTDAMLLTDNLDTDDEGMVTGVGRVYVYPDYMVKGYPLDAEDGITFVTED